MKSWLIAALGGALLTAGAAAAADNEAGVPLTPAEAAGAWTLSVNSQAVCTVTLGARHTAHASANCAPALPGEPTGWEPTSHGMRLTGPGGQSIANFDRWSNSLFVAKGMPGGDLQLRRGGPGA